MADALTLMPTLEDTMRELVTNRYLANIVRLAHENQELGCGGVDCWVDMVAGHVDDDETDMTPSQQRLRDDLESMTYTEMVSAIPYLRRLGYSIVHYVEVDLNCPFAIYFPGHARNAIRARAISSQDCRYMYSTTPAMLRMRGLLWTVPRLLRWKYRALQRYYHPNAPGGRASIAEGVAMVNEDLAMALC